MRALRLIVILAIVHAVIVFYLVAYGHGGVRGPTSEPSRASLHGAATKTADILLFPAMEAAERAQLRPESLELLIVAIANSLLWGAGAYAAARLVRRILCSGLGRSRPPETSRNGTDAVYRRRSMRSDVADSLNP